MNQPWQDKLIASLATLALVAFAVLHGVAMWSNWHHPQEGTTATSVQAKGTSAANGTGPNQVEGTNSKQDERLAYLATLLTGLVSGIVAAAFGQPAPTPTATPSHNGGPASRRVGPATSAAVRMNALVAPGQETGVQKASW